MNKNAKHRIITKTVSCKVRKIRVDFNFTRHKMCGEQSVIAVMLLGLQTLVFHQKRYYKGQDQQTNPFQGSDETRKDTEKRVLQWVAGTSKSMAAADQRRRRPFTPIASCENSVIKADTIPCRH